MVMDVNEEETRRRIWWYVLVWVVCSLFVYFTPDLFGITAMPTLYFRACGLLLLFVSFLVAMSARVRVYLMQQFLFASEIRLQDKVEIEDAFKIVEEKLKKECAALVVAQGKKVEQCNDKVVFRKIKDRYFALMPAQVISDNLAVDGYLVSFLDNEAWKATGIVLFGGRDSAIESLEGFVNDV